MKVKLLLLHSVLCLALATAVQSEDGSKIKTEDVYRSVITPCIESPEYEEFYSQKREEEAAEHIIPHKQTSKKWPNAYEVDYRTFICYYGREFKKDIRGHTQDVETEYYTWCLYIYSREYDNIYGCINTTHKWGSPEFEALGFLENMEFYRGSSTHFADKGNMRIKNNRYILSLDNAYLSCKVDWPWKNGTTASYYKVDIDISVENSANIRKFPTQKDAFLVVGQPKILRCGFHGGYNRWRYTWSHDGEYVQEKECRIIGNETEPVCSDVFFTLKDIKSEFFTHCASRKHDVVRDGNRILDLNFTSPSVNHTGEYMCASSIKKNHTIDSQQTLFIGVVFAEYPSEGKHVLPSNNRSTFACKLKAPTNSRVYWRRDIGNTIIGTVEEPLWDGCGHGVPEATIQQEEVDDIFSMFHLEIKFCNVNVAYSGKYSCVVEYTYKEENYTAEFSALDVDISAPAQDTLTELASGVPVGMVAGVTAGVLFFALPVAVLLSILGLVLFIKHLRKRRDKRRASRHRLQKVNLMAQNKLYTQVSISSPGEEMEFPRENLKLLEEVGKGRFGKVCKAQAHGIVPGYPNLNIVAVKSAVYDTSPLEIERLKEELEIMLDLNPHVNICNLLGYCTTPDGPLYLILEYACYGSLKKYLELCGSSTQDKQQEATERNTEAPPDKWYDELLPYFDRLAKKEDCDDMSDSLYYNDDIFNPCALKEEDICNFAHQIACGLSHLENMNVVHCDLAARNILIAEGFVLKISDFGLARSCAQDKDYIRDQNNAMLAAKWAPPEVLEDQKYSYKSDVWSFAIVVWEIASYGAHPYSDFKIGFTLDSFIQYLKAGNKLTQPNELSNHIYDKLCSCWSVDPDMRPSITSLMEFFGGTDSSTSESNVSSVDLTE